MQISISTQAGIYCLCFFDIELAARGPGSDSQNRGKQHSPPGE